MNYNEITSYYKSMEVDEDQSWYTPVTDFAKHGITASIASGAYGLRNTGAAFANMLGADIEEVDFVDKLNDIGMTATAKYAEENRTLVDFGGVVVGSVLPGVLGMKALHLAQKGLAASTSASRSVTGIRAALVPKNQVDALAKNMRETGTLATSEMKLSRRAASQGFHQQFLEAAFAETAIVLTMNQHSMLNDGDLDYLDSIGNNMGSLMLGTVLGGGIGGVAMSVRLKNEMQGAVRTVFSEARDGISLKLSKSNLDVNPGDAIALALEDLSTLRNRLGSDAATNATVRTELFKIEEQARFEIGRLVRETSKSSTWAGSEEYGGHLSLALTEMLLKGEVDKSIHSVVGLSKIKGVHENYTVFEPRAEVNYAVESVDEYATKLREHFPSMSQQEAMERAQNSFDLSYGTATSQQGKGIAIVNMPMADSQQQAMFTLRHEIGHLTGWKLARRLEADELGQQYRREMVKASRMARPGLWARADRYQLEIKEFEKQLADLAPDSAAYDDVVKQINSRKADIDYVNNPDELLADSLAVFTSDRYEAVSLELKSLDSLFRGNNAIRSRMRTSDAYMDLKNGKLASQVDRQPTIADMGTYRLQGAKAFVKYGQDTRVYEGLDKPLDVMKDTPVIASAKYLWAKSNPIDLELPEIVLRPDDFVGHYRALEAMKSGYKGNVIVDDFDPRTGLRGTRIEFNMAVSPDAMQANFRKYSLKEKARVGQELRTKNLSGKDKPQAFSETDIARVLDTDVKWQQYAAIHKGIKEDSTEMGMGSWSETYDPRMPTQVKLTYDRDLNAPRNEAEVRSAAMAKKRTDMVRQAAQSQILSYYGSAFKGAKFQLPPTTLQAGENRYRKVVETDDAQGFFGAQQGAYGSEVEHANASGRSLGILGAFSDKRISEGVEPAVHSIARDPAAVAELAVSTSKFRQYKMEEVPPEWKFTGMDAQGGAVKVWFNRIAQSAGEANDPDVLKLAAEKAKALNPVLDQLTAHVAKAGALKTISSDLLAALEDFAMATKVDNRLLTKLDEMIKHQLATVENASVANYWRALREVNQHTVKGAQLSASLRGKSANWNANQFYPGTIDRDLYKVINFVKPTKPGLMGDREFMIIGGPNAEVVEEKLSLLRSKYGNDFETITPNANAERHKQLLQDYEDGLNIDSFYMDHSKLNTGKAADIMPDPNIQIAWSTLQSYKRQARGVLTNLQKQYYDEEFQLLQTLEDMRLNSAGDLGTKNKEASIAQDRMATMLNMPNDNRFKTWRNVQRAADELFSDVWNTIVTAPLRAAGVKAAGAAEGNYQEMNKLAEKYGLPQPYNDEMQDYLVRSQKVNSQILASVVPKLNWIGATFTLRLDYVQPIINAISLPILANPEIKHLIDAIPELRRQALGKSLTVEATDKAGKVLASEMSNGKLMSQATVNWFKKPELREKYMQLGIIGERAQLYMNAVDSAALVGQKLVTDAAGAAGALTETMGKTIDYLAKWGDSTEDYVRFMAADMANQVLTAAGVTGKVADMAIQTYVNRVTGNYHYAQRPAMFQGWAGQAVGLFQTYQFNLIQQLMRHLGEKPSRAAAMMGLQTGIFGMQSTPGFELLNNHVAERSNYEGDFYTGINNALGGEMPAGFGKVADWMLYGIASNFTRPMVGDGVDFFSRGNLNPRSPIIIPSSLDEVPLVSMATKFFSSMGQAANNLAGGVPVWDTFTQALATNGVNRPLQGIGQLMAGERITSQGSTLLNTGDLDFFQMAARVAGARGMDEAVAVATYYRAVKFEAARQEDLKSLGSVVKANINANNWDGEQYNNTMQEFVNRGGDINTYDTWSQNLFQSATQSQIYNMHEKNDNVTGRYMQQVMGADVTQYINPWNVPE